MWRKFSWGFMVIYNVIRMPLLYLFNNGKIKFDILEIISPKARLKVGNGGSIKLGRKCNFEEGTLIRSTLGEIKIGDGVYINRNCNLIARESIIIENGVTIGPNVCIYDHDHNFSGNKTSHYRTAPIVIGKNVWIGANVIILKGVTIGDGSVIGAGTVISKNVPANTLIVAKSELVIKTIV
jgi:acetyltransferase-like isoleucine patch superfamily enzyme